MKKNIHDLSFEEIQQLVLELGEKKYRAEQLFFGIYEYKAANEISNLPKELARKLEESFEFQPLEVYFKKEAESSAKFVLKTRDGNLIECVLMKYKYGNTVCVSTQIGCRMGCKFCASTKGGLIRNLSSGEILSQVLLINRELGGNVKERQITNIVLMGMGEPLDNYDETVKFLRAATNVRGINISARNISLSTCGFAGNIRRLAEENIPVTLSLSLHATTDAGRLKTMPIAAAYKLKDVIAASAFYEKKANRRVCLEYITTKDNTTAADAVRLQKISKELDNPLINLIVPNVVEGGITNGLSRDEAYVFGGKLKNLGMNVTLRRSLGAEIEGACGQLRAKLSTN